MTQCRRRCCAPGSALDGEIRSASPMPGRSAPCTDLHGPAPMAAPRPAPRGTPAARRASPRRQRRSPTGWRCGRRWSGCPSGSGRRLPSLSSRPDVRGDRRRARHPPRRRAKPREPRARPPGGPDAGGGGDAMTHERIEQRPAGRAPRGRGALRRTTAAGQRRRGPCQRGQPTDGVPHRASWPRWPGSWRSAIVAVGRRVDSRCRLPRPTGREPAPGMLPSATASPSASPRRRSAACRAEDFAVASDPWDSAAGSRGTTVVFRVVDSTASLHAARRAHWPDHRCQRCRPRHRHVSPAMARVRVVAGTQLELACPGATGADRAPAEPLTLEIRSRRR